MTDLRAVADFCRDALNSDFPKEFSKLAGAKKTVAVSASKPAFARVRHGEKRRGAGRRALLGSGKRSIPNPADRGIRPCRFQPSPTGGHLVEGFLFQSGRYGLLHKNYRGEKFILDDYVNRDAYLISPKTQKGRELQAQELPGLWNGGMAFWNTIFVELPLAGFQSREDRLRSSAPQHRIGRAVKSSTVRHSSGETVRREDGRISPAPACDAGFPVWRSVGIADAQ